MEPVSVVEIQRVTEVEAGGVALQVEEVEEVAPQEVVHVEQEEPDRVSETAGALMERRAAPQMIPQGVVVAEEEVDARPVVVQTVVREMDVVGRVLVTITTGTTELVNMDPLVEQILMPVLPVKRSLVLEVSPDTSLTPRTMTHVRPALVEHQ